MCLKTKIVLSTSTLKELIGFKVMISTIKVNTFGGKKRNYFFIVFSTYLLMGLLKCQVQTLVELKINTCFHVFIIYLIVRSSKSM
jgi:hypothetical protein